MFKDQPRGSRAQPVGGALTRLNGRKAAARDEAVHSTPEADRAPPVQHVPERGGLAQRVLRDCEDRNSTAQGGKRVRDAGECTWVKRVARQGGVCALCRCQRPCTRAQRSGGKSAVRTLKPNRYSPGSARKRESCASSACERGRVAEKCVVRDTRHLARHRTHQVVSARAVARFGACEDVAIESNGVRGSSQRISSARGGASREA